MKDADSLGLQEWPLNFGKYICYKFTLLLLENS